MSEIDKDLVILEINQTNEEYQNLLKLRFSIKNWLITVWAGSFIAITTSKLNLSETKSFIILASIIIFFWFLESIYGTWMYFMEEHMIILKECLINGNNKLLNKEDIIFRNWSRKIKVIKQIIQFRKCLLGEEAACFFYVCLFILSYLLINYRMICAWLGI